MFSLKLSFGKFFLNKMPTFFKYLVLVLGLFSLFSNAVYAQTTLSETKHQSVISDFDAYLTKNSLAFNEIQIIKERFIKVSKFNSDDLQAKYMWIKLTLNNPTDNPSAKWHMLIKLIPLEKLTYFTPQKNDLWTINTIQLDDGSIPRTLGGQMALPLINLRKGKNVIYMRFEGLDSVNDIPPITLYSDDEFLSKHSNHLVFMGGIIAILVAMVFYNLILFAIVKCRYFLLYCLFNGSFALFAMVGGNVLYDSFSIFSGSMWWNFTYFFASIGSAALILFLWDFLEKEKLEKWMTLAILPSAGFLTLIGFFSLIATPQAFPAIVFIFNIAILISAFVFLGVLVRSILLESRAAKLILLSVIILFTSAIIKAIAALVVSVEPTWINNLLYFGLATQGMLLSVALTDRLNQRKLESEIKRIEAVEKSQSSTDLAFTDSLTGLRNRRFIEKVSPPMIENIQEGKGEFSLMICGVDGLAKVNQNHGREMGDEAIKAVGEVLKKALQGEDCIARYRGSEFVILLEGSNETIALGFGKQLNEMIKDIKLPEELSDSNLTFSIGISPAVKQDTHVDEVIKRAEMALFAAQQAGGNNVMGIEALSTLMGRNLLPHDEEAVKEQTSQAEQALPAGLEHTTAAKKIEAEKTDEGDVETEAEENPSSKKEPTEEKPTEG